MKKVSTWQKVRKFLNDIHLWAGLISGIIVFVVCFTGTVYVYNTEIREAASPEYYKVNNDGASRLPADSILAITRPGIAGEITGIQIPHDRKRTVAVFFKKRGKEDSGTERRRERGEDTRRERQPESRGEEGKRSPDTRQGEQKKSGRQEQQAGHSQGGRRAQPLQMMVNPYTGEMIGEVSGLKTATADFMQKMFGLHRWLLLNEIDEPLFEGVENRKLGSWITGTATILFTLGVVTGIIIWFPQRLRNWKNGLKIKWSANWKRVNHDLHNTLGFYSCIILFLMGVTGPFWSFDWYRTGWRKVWNTYEAATQTRQTERPQVYSILPDDGKAPITLEETMAVADAFLPYSGDYMISFASGSTGTISVSKNRAGFFAPAAADKLVLDQYSGKLLEKDIFREKPLNERISLSIKSLHVGNVYGQFTKLLYFVSCLIATSLPVTGALIWINKMKKCGYQRRVRYCRSLTARIWFQ